MVYFSVDDQKPILSCNIPGANAKMPFELLLFEDSIVCTTFWTFKSKKTTTLFKDIKRVRVHKNETGWPKFLMIFLKNGTNESYDMGYSKIGLEIQQYIEPKLTD